MSQLRLNLVFDVNSKQLPTKLQVWRKYTFILFLYFIRIDSFYSLYQNIIVNFQLEIRDRTGRVVFRWERFLWSFSPLSFCRKALNIIISTSVNKPVYFYVGYISESGMNIISSYDLEFHKMQNLGDNQRWCLASWPKNKRARWAQVWSQGGNFWQEENGNWVLLSNIAFIIIISCFVIIITTTHLCHHHLPS